LINLEQHNIYLRLAIDGKSSKPFSALTLPPFYKFMPRGKRKEIIGASRSSYTTKRDIKRILKIRKL